MANLNEKEKGILIGFIAALNASLFLMLSYWLIWLTPRGDTFPSQACSAIKDASANCVDIFVQCEVIFSFMLPFIIFAPVGYLINATSPSAAKAIKLKKWKYSALSLVIIILSGIVFFAFGYEGIARYIVHILFSVGLGLLLSVGWTVFCYNTKHPPKPRPRSKKK